MAASTLLPHDVWRRSTGLITPPMSTALVSLPPITYFDRRPTQCLQDASDSPLQRYDDDVDVFEPPFQHKPFIPDDAPHLIDWFDSSLKRPASFIAEKTCEMVCYLWFSSPSPSSHISSSHQIPSPPYSPEIPATTSPLQLAPSAAFVQFMHKLLETTQERNRFTNGLPGSEFRIAVAALMMANKFLDDNTYTNKTWSEVSGIDLSEIHKMEREFLTGGLVLAKETESRKWRGIRARYSRHGRQSQPMTSVPVARTYRWRCHSTSHRARSTSPMQPTNPHVSAYHVTSPQHEPSPSLGTKRSAADAFSPTSVSFKELPPLKRPTGMTLQIPETNYPNCPSSGSSPLDSLYSLAKMTLSSSPHAQRSAQSQPRSNVIEGRPQTLIAAYRADRPVNVPQSLYYYSLAGSSINGDSEQPKGNRKARLRFQQPPPYVPMDVQSASVSPHDSHVTLGARQPSLPHLHDAIWARKLSSSACGPAHTYTKVSPVESDQSLQLPPLRGDGPCAVPSAPFANAGPPGHPHPYHPHRASHHRGSPAYPSPHTWTYGR
ncbi:hypothetical protein F5141DRAFT_1193542 [Pisolithus sp. B1]|nr:hypothetical protein F5141DRAFT_1193542 [Pisolithus sp. B1]